jgi:hypothetical protein
LGDQREGTIGPPVEKFGVPVCGVIHGVKRARVALGGSQVVEDRYWRGSSCLSTEVRGSKYTVNVVAYYAWVDNSVYTPAVQGKTSAFHLD